MASSAHVTSIDALAAFKADLARFGSDASNALAGLNVQIRRAFEWLEGKLKEWQHQVGRRQELVTRAKVELIQQEYGHGEGRGPGYTEKKLALQKAQTRLREAEAKVAACQHWVNALPQEVIECDGPARQLAGVLESDMRQALGLLEQKVRALEAYIALTPTAAAGPETAATAPTPPGDGTAAEKGS
jgi:hypothetical protein